MYVKIRRIDAKPGDSDLIITISKTADISNLRELIFEKNNVEPSCQRLFYKGKQLEDGHSVIDYDVQLNDVIQLMVKQSIKTDTISKEDQEGASSSKEKDSEKEKSDSDELNPNELVDVESKYYKINDRVDMQDNLYGAWFEYILTSIKAKRQDIKPDGQVDEKNIEFYGRWEVEQDQAEFCTNWKGIRPRARYTYSFNELSIDQTVLVNYNIEDPTARGYWYDMTIKKISTQGGKSIEGTIHVGEGKIPLENCKIKFINEIMRIEEPVLIKDRVENSNIPMRKSQYYCQVCKDNKKRKCKECGCGKCGGKNDPDKIILCDECDTGFHLGCLNPPLETIPEDEQWYCPDCKNDENEIVKAGEKLKASKKKQKLVSKQKKENGESDGKKQRDWGKGMACVGRTKECTIVPRNHFGPIPGVDVGTCWKFRMQVAESGVHRPHVAGIHGQEKNGAYSIVLSGGYEDDVDDGNEFLYTGSGGRDLSGNKREANQSCDQTLTRMNKALALNCNAKFNDKDGAEAKDWKGGKPVRVVRNAKLRKHSKYAPKEGNRYDGIYKVVKYYPVQGKSGFKVWRYMLRRDDPNPAPWEEGGQEFDVIYPEGYLEAHDEKLNQSQSASENDHSENEIEDKKSKKRKRSKKVLKEKNSDDNSKTPAKKAKVKFTLSESAEKNISNDGDNEKLWKECKEVIEKGKQEFLNKVQDIFLCICCQEVVYKPITTECKHNVCKECLQRSFASQIYTCPYCRFDLGANYKMKINENLSKVLLELFPGYETTREK